ncbi:MAG: hypothetical protein IKX42_12790 [Fibrobacter sp.]|nr:hypothetical protein [Fibrobacter sp.]
MKIFPKILFSLLMATSVFAQEWDEDGWASTYATMAAFENRPNGDPELFNRPGYVKPIIDNLGNVLNSNWFASATVSEKIGFEVGLPISLIFIGDDDKSFNEFGMNSPTIFGGHADLSQPADVLLDGPRVYGNKTLSNLSVFTYPYLQTAVSFYHARLVMRGMFLPAISELRKFNLFGIGGQYSFGHLFQYMLPPAAQPLDVSVVLGYNTSGISYQPEDYSGTLNLDISTFTFDIVIGYKPTYFFEVMMTLGYQYANMASSGRMVCLATEAGGVPSPHFGQVINPNISVEGNSGFKFGLEVAFSLGASFHPVIGFDYAGKSSFTTNILYFKQQFGEDKTPDEIAKEKGYVRGAKKEESAKSEDSESEDSDSEEVADESSDETSAEDSTESAPDEEDDEE